MKSSFFIGVLLLISSSLFAQQDTLVMSKRQLADSIYGLLNTSNIPTGRLFNRQFFRSSQSTLFHFCSIFPTLLNKIPRM